MGAAPPVWMRIGAARPGWWAWLPSVPRTCRCTVSLTDPDPDAFAALRARGYTVVGHFRPRAFPDGAAADVLVPAASAAAAPEWARALSRAAMRVVPLAFGPAAKLLADLVEAHRLDR